MMDEPQVNGNAKPGAYPFADRANLFGTYHLQFNTNIGDLRRQAFHGMLSLTYPKWRDGKDKGFWEKYAKARIDGDFDDGEMIELTMEMCRLMDDLGTWDWQRVPEDYPEVEVATPNQ